MQKKKREEERRVERDEGKKFCTKGKDGRQGARNESYFFADTVWIEEAIGRQGSEYFWSPTLIFRLGKISVGKVTSGQ